jgi:hypothetical protein
MKQDIAGDPADGLIRVGAAIGLLTVLLVLPFATVDLPPLMDMPNHLARFLLLSQPVPELEGHYAVSLRLLPNLLGDLIVAGLAPLIGLEPAARILFVLCVLLPVLGCVALHRAHFGGLHWWPLTSGLFAFHGLFLLGFLNFSLGLGVALLSAAAWVMLPERRLWTRALAFAVLTWLTALCHVFALVFLLIVVWSREASGAWTQCREGRLSLGIAGRAAILALATLPSLWLAAKALAGGEADSGAAWGHGQRVAAALLPFAGYTQRLDYAVAFLFCGLVLLLAVTRRLAVAPGTGLALALFVLLFLTTPMHANAGGNVAPRFVLFALFLTCAALQPRLMGLSLRAGQGLIAAMVVARTASVAWAWSHHAPQLAELRTALEHVPAGARLATVTVERTRETRPYFDDQPRRALVSFVYERTDLHLGAIAVVERRAIWPFLFAYANQQPLRQVGPFADAAGHFKMLLPPRSILDSDRNPVTWPTGASPGWRAAMERSWSRWPEFFDYVLVLHGRAASDNASFLHDRLDLVHDAGFAVLYRVRNQLPTPMGQPG